MGVADFGRGNKAITYRALGVDMKIAFFRGQGTDGRSWLSAHRFCVWYHTLRPSFRCRYHTQNASTLGQLRPDREGNLNIKEMLKL